MNEQLPLDFLGVTARKNDPNTSKEAAKSVDVKGIRLKIMNALNRYFPEGANSRQIAELLLLSRDSVSPHMRPLQILGYVYASAAKIDSKTSRYAIVWKSLQEVPYVQITGGMIKCPHCNKPI